MTTITFSSFKGGVGKTTIGILVANAIAASNRRVLFIDLDHQRNSTNYYQLGQKSTEKANLASAIKYNDLGSGIVTSQIINVDLVPASFELLDYRDGSMETIADLLFGVDDQYDVVIIDCPPTLDNLVIGAWKAADCIITPVRLDSFDLNGIRFFESRLALTDKHAADRWIVVVNFFPTPRIDTQRSLDLRYDESFKHSVANLSDIRIPISAAVRNAIHDGRTITKAKTKIRAYTAILDLATAAVGEPIVPTKELF
jgi:chromosome partitioning protein